MLAAGAGQDPQRLRRARRPFVEQDEPAIEAAARLGQPYPSFRQSLSPPRARSLAADPLEHRPRPAAMVMRRPA